MKKQFMAATISPSSLEKSSKEFKMFFEAFEKQLTPKKNLK